MASRSDASQIMGRGPYRDQATRCNSGEHIVAKHDAIIVGTGQSGPSLAARFAGEGMKTRELDLKVENGKVVPYRARVNLSFKYESGGQ